jgi:hypothetical protein
VRRGQGYNDLKQEHADAIDSATEDPSPPELNPIDDDERARMRDARALGDLLGQGKIDRHEAVWRLNTLDNQRLSDQLAHDQADKTARNRQNISDQFVEQTTGRAPEDVPDKSPERPNVSQLTLDDKRASELVEENTKKLLEQYKVLNQQRARIEAVGADPVGSALDAAKSQPAKEAADAHIEHAGARFEQALASASDGQDALRSMNRVVMEENAAYRERQGELAKAIEKETDVHKRVDLETEKQIVTAEYLALTSDRIADNAVLIKGSEYAREAGAFRDRAEVFSERATQLREQYREDQAPHRLEVTADRAQEADAERRGYEDQIKTGRTVESESVSDDASTSPISDETEQTDAKVERRAKAADHGEAPGPESAKKPKERTGGRGGISM